jgi:hypothetical protein
LGIFFLDSTQMRSSSPRSFASVHSAQTEESTSYSKMLRSLGGTSLVSSGSFASEHAWLSAGPSQAMYRRDVACYVSTTYKHRMERIDEAFRYKV